jgi:RimJ/RimL family protein N-acetyltransferase
MTDEVSLRAVVPDDLPIFFENQLDPVAVQIAAFPSRDRETYMAHWARILADATLYKQTILFGDRVAGNMVSWEQDGEQEVGYWLGQEYWGKGIASRALLLFLDVVRTRPLYAHVARHNVASLRVLEKCGFALFGDDPKEEEYILKLEAHAPG